MAWTPLGAKPEEYPALVPGIPVWMRSSLRDWFFREFSRYNGYGGHVGWNVARMRRHDLAARSTPLADLLSSVGAANLFDRLDDDRILQIVDWLIMDQGRYDADGRVAALEKILSDGGSSWKVGVRNGQRGLEERVPLGVQDAADATIASAGDAGQLLSEAWHAAFGRNPDPEEAYEKAIKAVEEAGWDSVSPGNKRASLGTMVRDMKAQKDWKLDLPTPDADVPVKMAEALWVGQESRHGGNGYRKPTPSEAEAAVLLAVPLVQWFASGALARRAG